MYDNMCHGIDYNANFKSVSAESLAYVTGEAHDYGISSIIINTINIIMNNTFVHTPHA